MLIPHASLCRYSLAKKERKKKRERERERGEKERETGSLYYFWDSKSWRRRRILKGIRAAPMPTLARARSYYRPSSFRIAWCSDLVVTLQTGTQSWRCDSTVLHLYRFDRRIALLSRWSGHRAPTVFRRSPSAAARQNSSILF